MIMYRYKQSCGVLYLLEYNVLRETPKGKFITPKGLCRLSDKRDRRFVINYSIKRYAYETKGGALLNFIKRMERHIMFLEHNTETAKMALNEAIKMEDSQ